MLSLQLEHSDICILCLGLQLCLSCTGQTSEVLQEWATAEAQLSNKDFHNFRMEWNRKFVQKVRTDTDNLPYCPLDLVELEFAMSGSISSVMDSAGKINSWCEWGTSHAVQQDWS